MRCSPSLALALAFGLASAGALTMATPDAEAQRKRRKATDDRVDISQVKAELVVLTDDDGNFYVMRRQWEGDPYVFFGDGKTMHRQRVFTGGSNGSTGEVTYAFWSPRAKGAAALDHDGKGTYTLTCGRESVALKKASDAAAKQVLDTAAFKAELWRRQAQALARDDAGTYYYVDRMRDEWGGKGHRIFAGPKGGLKQLPMVNVVSDSVGEIYATKRGELRLVTSSAEARWIKGASSAKLTIVPVADNVELIYGDLGVYDGTLGTPCDDR